MDNDNKKLTPLKFLPDRQEMPWGSIEYLLADLGFVDSMACEGWLGGNTLSDILQTYLERLVGETSFEWYGTQFPVLVKKLDVKGRTSLHVNPDDETAGQRYDAFGKTALWYVEAAGPDARLYLGFKQPVEAATFYEACQDGSVGTLLHRITPKPGEFYLIPPGLVHAAKDVQLLEVAECSELWFRLHNWKGTPERELHLEEAFDLIDFRSWKDSLPSADGSSSIPQFTVRTLSLSTPVRCQSGDEDSFHLYICLQGGAVLQAEKDYALRQGELLLVPAELDGYVIRPAREGETASLLEVSLPPRESQDLVSEPAEE